MKENVENGLNIDLSSEVAGGVYANLAIISHSNSEFIVDFAKILPGMPKPRVESRIILAPEHAKRLLMALQDNIDKYEQSFGEIDLTKSGANLPQFPPVAGEA